MNRIYLLIALLLPLVCGAQVSFTGSPYAQNFNTLQATPNNTPGAVWTDNSTLPGWYASHTTYGVTDATMGSSAATFDSTGTAANVGLFSFGSAGSTDRAFGSRSTSSVAGHTKIQHAVRLQNNSGATITGFTLYYTGEQWFKSASSNAHVLTADFSTSATSLSSGTWTSLGSATFAAPVTSGTTPAALDGNASENKRRLMAVVNGISWPVGTDLWIRFTDDNESGSEQGLAVDDFIFTTTPASTLPYYQTFDSMGTAGTTAPAGWSFFGQLGGNNDTWTNAIGIPSADVSGGVANATLVASTSFALSSNSTGYNFALSTATADRCIGTSPTSGRGVLWQLALTNSTGLTINAITLGYDLRRFTAPSTANELPGYRLFHSLDGGATWTNVSLLNPTLNSGIVQVPNVTGVTSTPEVSIALGGAWAAETELRLRWVDDNANETSPDQVIGLDNVYIAPAAGEIPVVALTAPADSSVHTIDDPITLTANASDTDGSIAKVEFYQDAVKLGEDVTMPYEFIWNGAAAGNWQLNARATDNDGNVVISSLVGITVNTGSGSGTLTRGPYLNQGNQDSIVIRWRSSQAIIGRVRYGTSSGSLTQSIDELTATTEHEVKITGLAPHTRYYYSIGSEVDTLAGGDTEHTFRTSPTPGIATDTRIWVLGDAGRANASQASVRDAYSNWTGTRTPDLCLMLGDNAYNSGTDSEYQAAVFDMYPAFLRKMPLWSCIGNHDANGGSTSSTANFPYFDMFTFPTGGECGGISSGTERYFSFDYGNIHFINLDSQTSSRSTIEANGSDGAMAAWLRNDLAGVTATWIIAFFHHPPYSKGSHNSDTSSQLVEMRARFGPILEAGGVDLILSGHSHSYERSFFIDSHYGTSGTFGAAHKKQTGNGRPAGDGAYIKPLTGPRDHFGAVYTVTGSAGGVGGGTLDHAAMFVSYNTLGSFNIDINGNQLTATYIESDNDLPDSFTLIKQGAADSDGDGVSDAFEIAHGMNRFDPLDASIDTDFDGNDALAEYLFALDPNTSDRYGWTVTKNTMTGNMDITFPTQPQRVYRVWWSENLSLWQAGSASVSGDGTAKMWIDDGSVTGSAPSAAVKRFYRVQVGNGP